MRLSFASNFLFITNYLLSTAFRPIYDPIRVELRLRLRLYSEQRFFDLPLVPSIERFDEHVTGEDMMLGSLTSAITAENSVRNSFSGDFDIFELKQVIHKQLSLSLEHLHDWERDEIVTFLLSPTKDPSIIQLRVKVIELCNYYSQARNAFDSDESRPSYLADELRSIRNQLRTTLGDSIQLRSILAAKQLENNSGVRVMKNLSQSFQQLLVSFWRSIVQFTGVIVSPIASLLWMKQKDSNNFDKVKEFDREDVPWNHSNIAPSNSHDSDNRCAF